MFLLNVEGPLAHQPYLLYETGVPCCSKHSRVVSVRSSDINPVWELLKENRRYFLGAWDIQLGVMLIYFLCRRRRDSSVLTHASKLQGKLMLVHGLIDENVHFRHTARLINALIAARKPYDLLIFPDERHSPRKLQVDVADVDVDGI